MATESKKLADYEEISKATVKALHAQHRARLAEQARAATARIAPDNTDPALHQLALDLLQESERLRLQDYAAPYIDNALRLAANDIGAIETARKFCEIDLLTMAQTREEVSSNYGAAEVPPADMARFEAAAKKRKADAHVDAAFGDSDRIYLRMTGEVGAGLRRRIERELALMPPVRPQDPVGYTITDWNRGRATDHHGKQEFRIGALLRKYAPQSLPLFEQRVTENLMVVISRRPSDIARASTNRKWQSTCAGAGAGKLMAYGKMESGIKAGMMIAYVVSESDPDINNPLSRVMVMPFVRDRMRDLRDLGVGRMLLRSFDQSSGRIEKPVGDRVWFIGKLYGLANKDFELTVRQFIEDKLNGQAAGRFWTAKGVYADNVRLVERKRGMTLQNESNIWFE